MNEEDARHQWHNLAAVDDLPAGQMTAHEINGLHVALYNAGGRLLATDNICPHGEALLTDGYLDDTVIEFPDLKTIHTGDIIIDAIPVIDYPGGGSAIEFLTTIDRMLTLDFDTAILGHGRTMTKQEVRDYRMRFAEMNRRMKALIDRGVTKDQLKTWDQARAALKLEELGWENTVSWTTFFAGFPAYYDEIAASK